MKRTGRGMVNALFKNISETNSYLDSKDLRRGIASWLVVFGGLLLDRGITAIALILVANHVSPTDYGRYVASYGLATFLVVLPNLGLDSWLLAKGKTTSSEVGDLWKDAARVQLRLLVLWLLVLLVISTFLPADTYPVTIVAPSVLGAAFDAITLLSYSALRCINKHFPVSVFQTLSSLALLLYVVLAPDPLNKVESFAIIRTLVSGILTLVTIHYLFKHFSSHIINPVSGFRLLWKETKHFLIADLASTTYVKADINIVGLFIGAAASGVYGPALNLLQITFLAPRALFYLIVPRLSAVHKSTWKSFVQLSTTQLLAQILVGSMLSLVLFFFAPRMMNLIFGEAYHSSAMILRLLSPIPLLRSINFGLGAILSASGNQARRSRVQIGAAIFNIVSNLLAVITFGLQGVAVIYILSELYLVVGYINLVARLARPRKPDLTLSS